MTEPDSVKKLEKFEDLMKRYKGQMENALYAAEQTCPRKSRENVILCFEKCDTFKMADGSCGLVRIRQCLGDHIEQHDIIIPDDTTQAERKRNRNIHDPTEHAIDVIK